MGERPPVSADTLVRMATLYLARYSASTARLREVLERKVARRCERRGLPMPDADALRSMIEAAVERLTRAGLLDDAAYARGRAAALARKGLPNWRVRGDLRQQEVDGSGVDLDPGAQALRFAERKRLGPFRRGAREPYRDRDIRALVRAGHPVSLARGIVDGPGEEEVR